MTPPAVSICPNKIPPDGRIAQDNPAGGNLGNPIGGKTAWVLATESTGWGRNVFDGGPIQTLVGGVTTGFVLRSTAPSQAGQVLWTTSDSFLFETGYGIWCNGINPGVMAWVGTAGWNGVFYEAGVNWNPTIGEVYAGILQYNSSTGLVSLEINGVEIGNYVWAYNPLNETSNLLNIGWGAIPGNVGSDFQTFIDYGEPLVGSQLQQLRDYLNYRAFL